MPHRCRSATGGDPCWLPLSDEEDIYLARVNWTPDNLLLVQVQSRDQTRLDLGRIDPTTGESRVLWRDEVHPWVNLHDDLRFVRESGAAEEDYTILWSSERDGQRHLYLYSRDGDLLSRLTDGAMFIDRVCAVDADGGWVAVVAAVFRRLRKRRP
jgi:dipeptidyl-peptidase-4